MNDVKKPIEFEIYESSDGHDDMARSLPEGCHSASDGLIHVITYESFSKVLEALKQSACDLHPIHKLRDLDWHLENCIRCKTLEEFKQTGVENE